MGSQNKNRKNESALRYASLFCAGILTLNCVRAPVYVWAWEQGDVPEAVTNPVSDPGTAAGRLEITVTGPSSPIIEGYSEADPYRIQLTNPADGVGLSGFEVYTTSMCDVYSLVINEETGIEEEILVYDCPEIWDDAWGFLGSPESSELPAGDLQAEDTASSDASENANEVVPENPDYSENPDSLENTASSELDAIDSAGNTDKLEDTNSDGSIYQPDGTDSAGSIDQPDGTDSAGSTGESEAPEEPGKDNTSDPENTDNPEEGDTKQENPEESSSENGPDTDEGGTLDTTDVSSETYLASGESRSYLVRIPAGLPAGEYTETIIFQAAELEEPMKRSVSFVVQSAGSREENTDVPSNGTSSEGVTEDIPSDGSIENESSDNNTENESSNDNTEGGASEELKPEDPAESEDEEELPEKPADGEGEEGLPEEPAESDGEAVPPEEPAEGEGEEGLPEEPAEDVSEGVLPEEPAKSDSEEELPEEPAEGDSKEELPEEPEPSEAEEGDEKEDGEKEDGKEAALAIPLEIVSREGGNFIGDTFFAMSAVVYELIADPVTVSALFCDLNGAVHELPISDGSASFTLPDTYNGTVRFYTVGPDGSIMEEITEYVVAEATAPVLNYENITSPDNETCAVHVSIEDCGEIISGLNHLDCMVDGIPYNEFVPNEFGKVLLCSGEEAVSGLSFDIPLPDDEIHTIDVYAWDNAGNQLEQSFRVHAAPMDVVSVVLPTSFGMTIFPYASNGNIWGDDIVVANQSEFPVKVTLQSTQVNIDHTVPENRIMKSTVPVGNTAEQPIDLAQLQDNTIKDAFLNLNLKMFGDQNTVLELQEGCNMPGNQFVLEPKNPDTDPVALQNDSSEKSVLSGDYAIANIRGTIAEGSEDMWKDGDIAVSLTFTFQKLEEATEEEGNDSRD